MQLKVKKINKIKSNKSKNVSGTERRTKQEIYGGKVMILQNKLRLPKLTLQKNIYNLRITILIHILIVR